MKYTVKAGDSLSRIADTFTIGGMDYVPAIANYNNISNPNLIMIGQVLDIPDTWLKPEYQGAAPSANAPSIPGFPSPIQTALPPAPTGTAVAAPKTTIFGMSPTTLIIAGILVVGAALILGGKK